MCKQIAVVTRAWRGEVPYIKAWVNYYLDFLMFDKIYIIRCDEEKFDFLCDFKEKIQFIDYPASDDGSVFQALAQFYPSKEIDFLFSCDVDEFLVLHGQTIKEFINSHRFDSYYFKWALCCNVSNFTSNLVDGLKAGCSVGNFGKTLYRICNMESVYSEHEVIMKQNSIELLGSNNFCKDPYVMHFSSRSIEDLIIRGLLQNIKIETKKEKYIKHLNKPPRFFGSLPYRYKIAYFQTKLKKVAFSFDVSELLVDTFILEQTIKQMEIDASNCNLFYKNYDIEEMLKKYPDISFQEIATIESKRLLKI